MKELPITTICFGLSAVADRIDCTFSTVRSVKMLLSSLKPGSGRVRGTPPVARTSFVYGSFLPEAVVTDFAAKSTEVTSSEMVSIPA